MTLDLWGGANIELKQYLRTGLDNIGLIIEAVDILVSSFLIKENNLFEPSNTQVLNIVKAYNNLISKHKVHFIRRNLCAKSITNSTSTKIGMSFNKKVYNKFLGDAFSVSFYNNNNSSKSSNKSRSIHNQLREYFKCLHSLADLLVDQPTIVELH